MTPKTGPNVEKNFGDVIFSSKSTNEPIFIKIGDVSRNFLSHFLVPALLSSCYEKEWNYSKSNFVLEWN